MITVFVISRRFTESYGCIGRLYKMAGPISVTAFYCDNNMRLQQR